MSQWLTQRDVAALARDELERRRTGMTRADQRARCRASMYEFVKAAWPLIIPGRYIDSWHVKTMCEHYQALIERDILRLLVTIQPRIAKSSIFSVLGPAWAWVRDPGEKILSGSHADDLATRDTTKSRTLMQTEWFRSLFLADDEWEFSSDQNLKTRYSNTRGGHRVRTHVGGGTGDGGTFLLLDDPHNAQELHSETMLAAAWQWWGETWVSRLDDTTAERGVMAVVGQRIGEGDLIGHLLDGDSDGDRWVHLCLPTRYDPAHKYVTMPSRELPSGRVLQGDVRTQADELIAPAYQSAELLADRTHDMARSVFAAQYQQLPAPKEGFLLKRALWRYYPPEWGFYGQGPPDLTRLPEFRLIVHSWDTSVKDRAKSDMVSGQVWGVPKDRPADRWLLRLWRQRLGLNATIDAMQVMYEWSQEWWPGVRTYVVVENAANGPDAMRAIRAKVQGVVAWEAKGTKYQRAEAASPALDGRNCVLPGEANVEGDSYDVGTPFDVQEFIEQLAGFQGVSGEADDDVDGWSQMVNFTRRKARSKGRVSAPAGGRLPDVAGLPSLAGG